MTLADLDAIKSRISRAFSVVQDASGPGYVSAYQAPGTDFITNFRAIGVKAPEQIEDDFLNLFIWTWSLKDHLKECSDTTGLNGKVVEEEVNRCRALAYVSDIANRVKHGVLSKSRLGVFAELVDVGFNAPLEAIERISVAGPEVILQIKDPAAIQIHADVITRSGARLDALAVLKEAMQFWETRVLSQIAA